MKTNKESKRKIPDATSDAMSEEKVEFWARAGRRRRLEEKIEYEREHYERV